MKIFREHFTDISPPVDNILQSVESDHRKWIEHGEYHPDIDHFDVGSCGQRLGDSNKAEQINGQRVRSEQFNAILTM